MASTYEYVGDGQGVPGLPKVITDEEAKAMGDTSYPHSKAEYDGETNEPNRMYSFYDLLMDAVQAGTYKKVTAKKPKE